MNDDRRSRLDTLVGVALIGVLAIASAILFSIYRHELLDVFASHEEALRATIRRHLVLSAIAAGAILATMSALPLPTTALLMVLIGWLFPFVPAFFIVNLGATAGAILTFLVTRAWLRDRLRQWFPDRTRLVESTVQKEGVWALISLRLTPGLPYWLVNGLFGLTAMPLIRYWTATQLTLILPHILHVAIGHQIPQLSVLRDRGIEGVVSPRFIVTTTLGMLALSLLPWIVRRFVVPKA